MRKVMSNFVQDQMILLANLLAVNCLSEAISIQVGC